MHRRMTVVGILVEMHRTKLACVCHINRLVIFRYSDSQTNASCIYQFTIHALLPFKEGQTETVLPHSRIPEGSAVLQLDNGEAAAALTVSNNAHASQNLTLVN